MRKARGQDGVDLGCLVEFKMEIWFYMRVPMYATVEEQAGRVGVIQIEGPSTRSGDVPFPFRPQKVTLNDQQSVLCTVKQ
jgi:hypothetical protein